MDVVLEVPKDELADQVSCRSSFYAPIRNGDLTGRQLGTTLPADFNMLGEERELQRQI